MDSFFIKRVPTSHPNSFKVIQNTLEIFKAGEKFFIWRNGVPKELQCTYMYEEHLPKVGALH